ncbi:MAG: hypothetical protein ABIP90_04360 [Vicinamibacterales bacterium]
MRWQSVARAVVALIGVGCAVAVYVLLRPRPQITEPPRAVLLDDTATSASKGTKMKRVDASGNTAFSMDAGERLSMADGRTLLKKGVTLKFVKNEVHYTVTGTDAETSGKSGPTGEEPSKIVFQKKVKMVGDNGFSVEAEDATYLAEEQRVIFPGAVVFNRDRMQGRGVGADLYMDRSVFWLNDQAHMTIKPQGSGVPVDVSGKRIGLAQNDGYLRAEEGARLTREAQQLSSDAMTVHFAEGTQSVRRIEMLGKSNVRKTGTGKRPDMRGDNIDLDFTVESGLLTHARMDTAAILTLHDDAGVTQVTASVIDFYVGADGETLTKLEATGPTQVVLPRVGESPARTIQSVGLIAEGVDPKGLDRAVFNGGVQYREALPATRGQAAAVRLASSQSLVLGLEGALNQVTLATFRQNFCFVGPVAATAPALDAKCALTKSLPARGTLEDAMAAAADEGQYDAKAESLQLRSPAPKRPWVVNREVTVDAQEIDINIKENAINARWDKKVQIDFVRRPTLAQGKEPGAAGLFESDKPIIVKTNSLKYSKATGLATYSGGVFMFQENKGQEGNRLKADIVRVDDQKHDIAADGNVYSISFIEQAPDEPGKKGPTRTVLTSDKMTYTEAVRRAVYVGKAKMESGAGANRQNLEADQISLELHTDRRALKWLEGMTASPGLVIARLPEGRQTTGLRLTYDADKDLYVVTGKPAQFVTRAPTKGPDICDVGTGTSLEFPRTGGLASVKNEGVVVGSAGDRKCSEVIK